MNWTTIKPEYEQHLINAGISNKEFKTLYLRFARRINTCLNMLANGSTWGLMINSNAYWSAYDILLDFNGGGHTYDEPKFFNEWKALCKANNFSVNANVGDWLA